MIMHGMTKRFVSVCSGHMAIVPKKVHNNNDKNISEIKSLKMTTATVRLLGGSVVSGLTRGLMPPLTIMKHLTENPGQQNEEEILKEWAGLWLLHW